MFRELFNKLCEYEKVYKELKAGDPDFNPNDIIFCDIQGNPRNPDYACTLLNRFTTKAGIRQIGAHTLRHGWITDLLHRGFPLHAVSKMAGHSCVETTAKIYAHHYPEDDLSIQAFDKIDTSERDRYSLPTTLLDAFAQ